MDRLIVVMVIAAISVSASKKNRPPTDFKTCSECITAHKKNAWCFEKVDKEKMAYTGPRCQLKAQLIRGNCKNDIEAPDDKLLLITKNKPLRTKRPISPQKVNLKLRKGASATIPIEVFSQKESVTVKLRHPRAAKITVKSNCPGFEWKKKMATCKGLSTRKVNFTVTVNMRRCLPKQKKIKITVDGNKKKTMKIFLKSRCKCGCEKDSVPNSPSCSGHGNLTCGTCSCNPGYHGTTCECDASEIGEDEAIGRCTPPNNNATVCSGRGVCVCGFCHCANEMSKGKKYVGRYCDVPHCDNKSCRHHNGQICGGSERGSCKCGKCRCMPGYGGKACENSLATDNCLSSSGKICNDQGTCINNRCRCSGTYIGRTCEECPTCEGMCKTLKDCVRCFAFRSGPIQEEDCLRQCDMMANAVIVDDVDVQAPGELPLLRCQYRDDDNCLFKFAYSYQDVNTQKIRISRTKVCPPP